MSSAHSMNARKCVHAQKPYPVRHSRMNQAREEEEEKERKREARRQMERKAAKKKKISEELKQAYLGTDRLTKQGEEPLTSLRQRT